MNKNTQNRREFIKAGAAGLATVALFRNSKGAIEFIDGDPFPELVEVTIPQLQAKMKSGQLTSRRLVEMYLERLKQVHPKTRSILELHADAIAIADQPDTVRNTGKI